MAFDPCVRLASSLDLAAVCVFRQTPANAHPAALDDPTREVKVVASDGRTGDQRDLAYTNCKVIGNGSFGIVFQARMVNVPKEEEDIAIKKVLQDKRFKVRVIFYCSRHPNIHNSRNRALLLES